mgnify:CR=1 FL=1
MARVHSGDPSLYGAIAEQIRRLRGRDQETVGAATDLLARLFVNPWQPLRIARNLGLLGLDLLIGHGERVGLLGPNGAGKTTLLRTLLGFYPPAAGTARVFGRDLSTDDKAIRSSLGYMPESDAHIADARFRTNFRMPMRAMWGLRLAYLRAEEQADAFEDLTPYKVVHSPIGSYAVFLCRRNRWAEAEP